MNAAIALHPMEICKYTYLRKEESLCKRERILDNQWETEPPAILFTTYAP